MNNTEIRIFSPATVANVACGFDVLGFCLNSLGDEMVIRKTDTKGVIITKIEGFDLPYETEKNVAGVSALALYQDAQPDFGFEIEIYKHIKPGSGVGSSSASAVGSVFGMNELLGKPYTKEQLTQFAMKGEALASQSEHADNIAPGIYGGFTLVKSVKPLRILELPCPNDLFAVILHPQIEIKTSEARALLPKEIPMDKAVIQWANLGSFVHAMHTNDYELLSSALADVLVEPFRKQLIPEFDALVTAAKKAGALGCGISGSGPSVFALCKGRNAAIKIESSMKTAYANTNIKHHTYISAINLEGIKILS